MTTAKAEAAQVLIARESTFGTAPATLWQQLQPNAGGIQGWQPEYVDVNRDPLSKLATMDKGEHVGLNANVTLVHDLNKDLLDNFAEGFTRSVAKVPGNQGVAIYRPTAVTGTSYTVPSLGALTAGLLIFARGFAVAGNNGLRVVGASSTGTAINASGLVAETVSPAGSATVEVCGVQGASADITLNASGNLTSTTLNFTTLGLTAGVSRVKLGGPTAITQFATAAYNGWATVDTIAANLITLKWRTWTPGSADLGTGKTIQIAFGRVYRNVSIDNADYLEPSWHGELEDSGVGAANAAVFTYARGLTLNSVSISIPVESKIEATLGFMGADVAAPVLAGARVSGPSTAWVPLATEMFDTTNDIKSCRIVVAADDTSLVAEVNSLTLTIDHGVTPRKQLGTFGTAAMIFGKNVPTASCEIYYERSTVPDAIRANTTCRLETILRNESGAVIIDLPAIRLAGGAKTYAANSPVMMSLELPTHRDPLTNIVQIINVLPYAFTA
jgi:hypothetical protein